MTAQQLTLTPHLSPTQARVMEYLAAHGWTSTFDLVNAGVVSAYVVRTRTSELYRMGLVEKRPVTIAGRSTSEWRVK